jgi:DNA invertase Pin-like site-specific DNA recombinase
MRANIYARYSSDHQRAASIDDQVRLCREFIERSDWTLAEVYSDAAMTGSNLLRPGVQAIVARAMAAA